MINYKEIIENLSDDRVKDILTKLEIPFKETSSYLLCPTVCHNADIDEASWKLYYYKNNHIFYCYTSCDAMSIFSFLKNFYETRDIDYDWYNDIYLLIVGENNFEGFKVVNKKRIDYKERYKKREKPSLTYYPKGILDVFTKYHTTEWLQDGITHEAMDKFDIRYSISRNKIIIPHYDVNNNLIGIRGRALNEWEIENIGKYTPVTIENTIYKHPLSLNLYGLNVNKNNIIENGYVCLAEGEKSVLQAESFKRPNCTVATCGSNLNIYQIKLIMEVCKPKEIIVCYDSEELPGKDKYFNKLYNMCEKYKKYSNFSFIYDRERLLDLKQSPYDLGEDIFNQLLEERVRVR